MKDKTMKEKILVTGGTGYIGSHTTVKLQEAGYEVVIIDNLSNSNIEVLDGIEAITGKRPVFVKGDCTDIATLRKLFSENPGIKGIINFAASKAVGESVHKPILYYRNNLGTLLNLLECMPEFGVKGIVFSSSCTVYGEPDVNPIDETAPIKPATSPYGNTKQISEEIIRDVIISGAPIKSILLRYFNPIGAHKSGRIGEDPNGVPNNLMPYITQVAIGKRPQLQVYGDDYDTPDGTGVRDYIHVVDLALGHVKAVEKCAKKNGVDIYNLGTGVGYSVLDVVHAFEKASGEKIPYQVTDRRPGDIATCYSDPSKAAKELGWKAERGIEEMCEDSWRWQKQNPNGYPDEA